MSYKFDSLMTILNKLDRGERVTSDSLMRDLEVGRRTAYRYITTLMVAGFPISYDRQKGSYVFDEGYSLRTHTFSSEENLAFSMAKSLLWSLGPTMRANLEKIEHKIAMPEYQASRIHIPESDMLPVDVGTRLGTLNGAATNHRKVSIVYKALSTQETTTRVVDPYYLFSSDGLWQLRAFCHLRREFRTFALDQILSLKPLEEYFAPEQLHWQEEIAGSFGAYVGGEPTEVVLRFDEEIKPYIMRKRWHQSQTECKLPDGRLELKLTIDGLEGIVQWVYSWLPHVEVVAPGELRDVITKGLRLSLCRHKKAVKESQPPDSSDRAHAPRITRRRSS